MAETILKLGNHVLYIKPTRLGNYLSNSKTDFKRPFLNISLSVQSF